jgi:hypothetical protein
MRRRSPTTDTDSESRWTYSETIDEERSAIRVRGHVDRLGVDLLRGTIEQLSRRGHRHITVTMEHPDNVDTCARAVLAEVAEGLAGCEGRLTIRWSADEDDADPDLVAGRHRTNGRSPHRGGEVTRYRPAVGQQHPARSVRSAPPPAPS